MLNIADLRILLVDDELFMRATIKQMLRVAGAFEVETAETGEAALELVGSFKPDVVLCDIAMEPMSGIEFLHNLRDHSDDSVRGTSVVMLTADTSVKVVNEVRRLRVDGYLVKPVSPNQLSTRLGAVMAQKNR